MNIEQAMIEAVTGHCVRHDGLGTDTYVCYEFNGFIQQSTHRKKFGDWASCSFIAQDADYAADWYIYEPPAPKPAPLTLGQKIAAISTWGRQPAPAEPVKPVDPVLGIWTTPTAPVAAPAPPEADYDPDIEAIAAMPEADFQAGLDALKAAAPKRNAWGKIID